MTANQQMPNEPAASDEPGPAKMGASDTVKPPRVRVRRMARQPDAVAPAADGVGRSKVRASGTLSKLDQLEGLLRSSGGASIAELMAATGWQAHSVRGAIAGALKKRGVVVASESIDGVRRYRAGNAA